EADAGGDEPAEFVGFGPRHDAERDLARAQRGDTDLARNELALRRENRRDRDQILLFDIGIAQGIFEHRQLLAMDAHAAAEGNMFHTSLSHRERKTEAGPLARCQYRALAP